MKCHEALYVVKGVLMLFAVFVLSASACGILVSVTGL